MVCALLNLMHGSLKVPFIIVGAIIIKNITNSNLPCFRIVFGFLTNI